MDEKELLEQATATIEAHQTRWEVLKALVAEEKEKYLSFTPEWSRINDIENIIFKLVI